MSKSQQDEKPNTSDKSSEASQEDTGFLSLEAKAGLSLICILACGFSFMVWQQWKQKDASDVIALNKPADDEIVLSPKSPSESKSSNADRKIVEVDPFADQTEPEIPTPVLQVSNSASRPKINTTIPELPAETAEDPEENPFASIESRRTPEKANIPTLEIPAEIASTENRLPEKPAPFDPFGDVEFVAGNNSTNTSSKQENQTDSAPPDEFDPFAAEIETTAVNPDLEGAANPELPTLENNPFFDETAQEIATTEPEDDFTTTKNPFGDSGNSGDPGDSVATKKAATSESFPPETTTPKTDTNPFANPDRSQPDLLADHRPEQPAKLSPSFQDPLPLLEPVPSTHKTVVQDNPFGQFESIPAGAAQASSVTQIAPEYPTPKKRGTLADLNTPRSPELRQPTLPLGDNPFSSPPPTAQPFHLNPDGTYIIQEGDNYWSISKRAYGSSRYYQALAETNRTTIPHPEQLKPGVSIKIPSTQHLHRQFPALAQAAKQPTANTIVKASAEQETALFNDESGTPVYRVQKNDTLASIAQKHLGRASRWIQIYQLNRGTLPNPNQLKIGTMLKLPQDASRVKFVGEPETSR